MIFLSKGQALKGFLSILDACLHCECSFRSSGCLNILSLLLLQWLSPSFLPFLRSASFLDFLPVLFIFFPFSSPQSVPDSFSHFACLISSLLFSLPVALMNQWFISIRSSHCCLLDLSPDCFAACQSSSYDLSQLVHLFSACLSYLPISFQLASLALKIYLISLISLLPAWLTVSPICFSACQSSSYDWS